MKRALHPYLLWILISFFFSCSPQTKESYLNNYELFITEISNNHSEFSQEDWQDADERYEEFSVEWKKKFEDDLIWKDHLQLKSFEVQYIFYKTKGNSSGLIDGLFNNYNKLKEQVKLYVDNNMEKDLELLRKEAKDLGDVATKTLEQILKELELEN